MKNFFTRYIALPVAATLSFSVPAADLSTSQQIQQLYIAYLGRAADPLGLEYWTTQVERGQISIDQLRVNLVNEQPEYAENFGKLKNAELVSAVYQNLFNREPDDEGRKYWEEELNRQSVQPDQLIIAFINGAAKDDQKILANKLTAAECYTENTNFYSPELVTQIITELDNSDAYAQCPPIVKAGTAKRVNSGDRVSLSAAGRDLESGVRYQWSQLSGPAVRIIGADSAIPSFTAPMLEKGKTAMVEFLVVVTDNEGALGSDVQSINVTGIDIETDKDGTNSADGLFQAAFKPGTVSYEFGFNSIPNIAIAGAPEDTDFERCAMLHDNQDYRLYCFREDSDTIFYQFAFNSSTGKYEFGFNSIAKLEISGAPLQADSSAFAMLHDGDSYRLYMKSKVSDTTLYQFAFNPSTTRYEFGFNSIPKIEITGAPEDADFDRWAMLHDGDAYRLYFGKENSDATIYQFAFNPTTSAYEFGFRSFPQIALTNYPKGREGADFSMLFDGADYRLYLEQPNQDQTVVAGLNQAAYVFGTSSYQYGHNSIENIRISGAPEDTDLSRSAMLHDGDNYRLYFFRENSNSVIYQFAYNSRTGKYEYGFNSIPTLRITGIPADADTSSFAMLHDGSAYRLYLKDKSANTVHQFVFNSRSGAYEYGFDHAIPEISITRAPADTDFGRWGMLHDGDNYRLYAFKKDSATQFYQFAFNSRTVSYEFGFGGAIPELTLTDLPAASAFNDMAMLYDGSTYRMYFLD